MIFLSTPLTAEDYGLEVLGHEPLWAGGFQPFIASNHSLAFERFQGSRRTHNHDREYEFTHRWMVGLNYGVPRDVPGDFTLSFQAPIIYRDFRERTGYGIVGDQLFGIGDIGFFARGRYLWWVPGDNSERSLSMSISGGVEIPTGEHSASRDGIRVPREMQIGRGGYSLTAAHIAILGLGKLWYGGRADIVSVTRFRWNSVGVGGSNYDFGDEFSQELVFKLRVIQEKPYPANTMFIGIGAMFEARNADVDHGHRVHDTGYRELALRPYVQWHPRPWDIIEFSARIPVVRWVNNSQLVETVSFFVGYGRRF